MTALASMPDALFPLFLCPHCGGALEAKGEAVRCKSCDRTFPITCGLWHLEAVRAKPLQRTEPAAAATGGDWARHVRETVRLAEEPEATLARLAIHGNAAWRLLLPARTDAALLHVGCGSALASYALASQAASVHAIETDRAAARHLEARFAAQPPPANLLAAVVDVRPRLPLPDACFDVIAVERIPDTLGRGELAAFFSDLARLLKQDGQLLLIGANRFDLERLKRLAGGIGSHRPRGQPCDALENAGRTHRHTLSGLRSLLRRTGAMPVRECTLRLAGSELTEMVPLRGAASSDRRRLSIRQRLTRSPRLASAFALLGSRSADTPQSLVDAAIDQLALTMASAADAPARADSMEVTRKDKLVVTVRVGTGRAILKLPLSEAALASETRNHEVLLHLSRRRPASKLCPAPLATGTTDGVTYFAESHVPGAPLRALLAERGRTAALEQVFALVDALHPPREDIAVAPLDGDFYERLVNRRLEPVLGLVDSPSTARKVRAFFESRVRGIDVGVGLNHGDFSVSNLLAGVDGRLRAIDWEAADGSGIPALDAINYLDSTQRLFAPGQRIAQTLPLLANGPWPERDEMRFLARCYERLRTDQRHHEVLVWLRWLRHVGFLAGFWLQYDGRGIGSFVHSVIDNSPMR